MENVLWAGVTLIKRTTFSRSTWHLLWLTSWWRTDWQCPIAGQAYEFIAKVFRIVNSLHTLVVQLPVVRVREWTIRRDVLDCCKTWIRNMQWSKSKVCYLKPCKHSTVDQSFWSKVDYDAPLLPSWLNWYNMNIVEKLVLGGLEPRTSWSSARRALSCVIRRRCIV